MEHSNVALHLASGEEVRIRPNAIGLEYHRIMAVLPEALSKISGSQQGSDGFIEQTVVFERSIGTTVCVKTTATDEIVFARRVRMGRDNTPMPVNGLTRFVKNREPEPSSILRLGLKADKEGGFILVFASIGDTKKEPWDVNGDGTENEFWADHALIWGQILVTMGSETTEVPDTFKH